MQTTSSHTVSLWVDTADVQQSPPLQQNAQADVCIVGGGIAGLTTAYLLSREGQRVIVLDRANICGGETSRTTAHLAFVIDDGFQEIERMHGLESLRLHVQSHQAAIERIEQFVIDENIDCDFQRVDGYLFAPGLDDAKYIEDELAAAKRAGVRDVEYLDRLPLSFRTGPALRFAGQGQFHVLKYFSGLVRALQRNGVRLFSNTAVLSVEDGTPVRVHTNNGCDIQCTAAVVATNSPINNILAIHSKQAPYRTYAIGGIIPKGSVPAALYWDTEDPYHYVRLHAAVDHDMLIVGGEDHKTGQGDPNTSFGRLEQWTRERFGQVISTVDYRWSGQILEPVDGVAFIGRNPGEEHVYVATGDSGMGMTHGTIAGMLLTDLIRDRQNQWADIYSPSRKTLSAAAEYAKENLNVAAEYAKWVTPGDVQSVTDISIGEAGIVRFGAKKIAVYRDDSGQVHACSATCTHLGCIVAWNKAEKSWDCPCHGSRFGIDGRVLNGPATRDLEHFEGDLLKRDSVA